MSYRRVTMAEVPDEALRGLIENLIEHLGLEIVGWHKHGRIQHYEVRDVKAE